MNGEIFEVKGEIVELKREKQAIAATARLTESDIQRKLEVRVELVSKELNHLVAILHVYAGGLNFMK